MAGGRWAAGSLAAVVAAGTVAALAAPAGAAGTAKVNVVHGIPGAVVKICVDGKKVADDVRFGATIVGAGLPAGTHRVRVVAAGKPCAATPILKAAYDLAAGRNYTVVANLDNAGRANLKAFRNDVRRTTSGQARLTVRHTAYAPAVNVWANGARLISGSSFTWGKGATVTVPAGTYRAKVTLPGSSKAVIGPKSLTLKPGTAYQVYAVGSAGHYRLIAVPVTVGTS